MKKAEAMVLMMEGKKVTHRFFSKDEYITMNKEGFIIDENNYKLDPVEFWHYRTGKDWFDGWELYSTHIINTHWTND